MCASHKLRLIRVHRTPRHALSRITESASQTGRVIITEMQTFDGRGTTERFGVLHAQFEIHWSSSLAGGRPTEVASRGVV